MYDSTRDASIGTWVGPTSENAWRVHGLMRCASTGSAVENTQLVVPDWLSTQTFPTEDEARVAALAYGKSCR